MKQPGSYRGRSRGPAAPVDPVEAIRRYVVKLFDKGEGHAVDWPKVAEALFRVGFDCVDEAKGDNRAAQVVRRVQAGAYNRMAGTPDDASPYTSDAPSRSMAGQGPELSPGRDLSR